MELSNEILSDITIYMKYAKYIPELQRRETWDELVTRNMDMHIKKYPQMEDEIRNAYKMVYDKKVLPSMRSMQFAGKPIDVNPTRIFNCSYLPMDDWRGFSEVMFLLLGGTGVGYSVQKHHVEKLPEIKKPNPNRTRRYLVGDSIEGWADSIKLLMKSYFGMSSSTPIFDYSDIRQKGSLLMTSGGKAPGPQPLKDCVHNIKKILDAKDDNEKLTTLEVHDILCHIADAVLAGGIRRAALISLFSMDDEEMLSCKFGNWWELNPQRGRANNSAVILRHKITEKKFFNLWEKIKESGSGEPGMYFSNDKDYGTNPCVEISLRPYQFCNLCEVNVSDVEDQEELNERVKTASFIGTLQAGYTDFHYLRDIWRKTTEKESLIGVSMTGIGSGKVLKLNMKESAKVVKEENARVAELIGINKAARTTCTKPAGCQIPSTEIKTDRGLMSLDEIFKTNGVDLGDKLGEYREWYEVTEDIFVYNSLDEKKRINKLFVNGYEETVKFTMEDGSTIECTPNHKFMMKDGTWKEAREINTDDDFLIK